MPQLTHLTDEELARLLDNQPAELAALTEAGVRFPVLLTELAETKNLLSVIEAEGFDIGRTKDIERIQAALAFAAEFPLDQVRALMDVLMNHDIDSPESLQKFLAPQESEES